MAEILENILKKMVEMKGSDLHLKCRLAPHIRMDGDVVALEGFPPLDEMTIKKEVFSLISERKREAYEKNGTIEFSIERAEIGARFRGSFYMERSSPALNMRLIPRQIPSFESLFIPDSFLKFAEEERGIVLVTGPTGSGKSTALAALVDHINKTYPVHIITLEDPIEFVHDSKKALISQRELGEDFHSFPDALRHALRQDPDVILVGEMRDLDTIRLALHAAETGHLVLSTLHTVDVAQTVTRIIDMFPPHEQASVRVHLSELVKGIVALRLVQKVGGGRVPASEIMTGTSYCKKILSENKIGELSKAMEQGKHYGMQTFLMSLLDIHNKGLATKEDCMSVATNPDDFATRIRGIKTGT
ncbi:type IV pilus twitching motility protein PilT [Elusimicrobiota bacterium]